MASALFGLALVFPAASFAQDIQVEARIDSSEYLVGDWVTVFLKADRVPGISVVWPAVRESLATFDVVGHGNPVISEAGDRVVESASLTLAAFDTGNHIIPPLTFRYSVPGDTATYNVSTVPLVIRVNSVAIDTTQDIKDIKPPLAMPLSLAEVIPYLLGLVVLGVLLWMVLYFVRRRKRTGSILPKPPLRPPDEIALEALRILEADRLWQRGKTKEYHSGLTDILRRYLEGRFDIMAMEMTTGEIVSSPAISTIDPKPQNDLREILVLADLVKFAKLQPLPEENAESMLRAISFVESTRPRPQAVQERAAIEVAP
jgi:hypothetical protein